MSFSTRRVIVYVLIGLGLILMAAAAGVGLKSLAGAQPPVAAPATKTSASPCGPGLACIKLTAEDGTTYKLNDFRFLPKHCIEFISLPDGRDQTTCGDYKMDWIGPTASPQQKA